jgi:hypothetical protein
MSVFGELLNGRDVHLGKERHRRRRIVGQLEHLVVVAEYKAGIAGHSDGDWSVAPRTAHTPWRTRSPQVIHVAKPKN